MTPMKKKRLELGLTAARLAELAGTQEMRVYFLERDRFLPKVPEAVRLAGALTQQTRLSVPFIKPPEAGRPEIRQNGFPMRCPKS